MDYDLIVVKTLERVYKNYYYIIRGSIKGGWNGDGRTSPLAGFSHGASGIVLALAKLYILLLWAVTRDPLRSIQIGYTYFDYIHARCVLGVQKSSFFFTVVSTVIRKRS